MGTEANNVAELLKNRQVSDHREPTPVFFDISKNQGKAQLLELLEGNEAIQVIDTYETQLKEWFILQNPLLKMDPQKCEEEFARYVSSHFAKASRDRNVRGKKLLVELGSWVYLSWKHVVLHILEDDQFQEVRTGRNRNLITPEEQKQYYNSVIGIAGQSVGNSCALAIVLTGGGKHLRLADPDTLELTNLNRIRGSIADLTSPKVYMTARQVYELDPYAELDLFTDGLTDDNIDRFFDGPPKLDVIIDEMDNLAMKIRLRQEAKIRRIPIVMAADNGDSAVLDIERHDLDDDIPFFHGRLKQESIDEILKGSMPLPAMAKVIGGDLIGFDIHEERMLKSLLDIGKSIPTWPQLGTAAMLNGMLVATTVRRILTQLPLIEERAVVSIPSYLEPDYHDDGETQKRQKTLEELSHQFIQQIDQFLSRK